VKTIAEIRKEWIDTLFSTQPADRPHAAAEVRDLYQAAGFGDPQNFLWFDSPLQASWAVALLLTPHSNIWQQLLASAERTRPAREMLNQVRAEICRQAVLPQWDEALAALGKPLGQHWAHPDFSRGFPKLLQTEIVNARFQLYENPANLFAVPSDSDDLHRAEQQLFAGASSVMVAQVEWQTTSSIRSASFLADYSFRQMAADEVEAGARSRPPLLAAAWSIARSAGLWWPFANGAVLADRPTEVHVDERWLLHCAEGPAAVYRDGARLFAWHGFSLPERCILQPESLTPGDLKPLPADFRKYVETRFGKSKPAGKKAKTSDILKAELPSDPAARLESLRAHAGGRLTLFERYTAGEHTKVWSELVALGPAVRQDPAAADALAVA